MAFDSLLGKAGGEMVGPGRAELAAAWLCVRVTLCSAWPSCQLGLPGGADERLVDAAVVPEAEPVDKGQGGGGLE